MHEIDYVDRALSWSLIMTFLASRMITDVFNTNVMKRFRLP